MNILTTIAITTVMLSHIVFMVLEMFFWNTPLGHKVFHLKQDYA